LLYPPLITIFFVLIIFSLDALYYGDIKSKPPFKDANGAPLYATLSGSATDESLTPCYGVDSPFCATAKYYEGTGTGSVNLCMLKDLNQIWDKAFHTSNAIFVDSPFGRAHSDFAKSFLSGVVKMLLWSIIFWHFFAILIDLTAQILGIFPFTSVTRKRSLLMAKPDNTFIAFAPFKAAGKILSLGGKSEKST
jgi:hypothetical protein